MNRTPGPPACAMRENRTGRTGHEHFPAFLIPCRGATNTQGEAYAFHYGWSGGHRMMAEELPTAAARSSSATPRTMETEAADGAFETARLHMVYSNDGLNGCAVAFQRHAATGS
jgi:alpha-galactosidase